MARLAPAGVVGGKMWLRPTAGKGDPALPGHARAALLRAMTPLDRLWRHIEACNNIASPAHLVPFRIGEEQVGWMGAELARALSFFPRDVHFDGRGAALAG